MGGQGSGSRANPVVRKRYTIRSRRHAPPVSFHATFADAVEQLGRMTSSYYKITVDRIVDGKLVASAQVWPCRTQKPGSSRAA